MRPYAVLSATFLIMQSANASSTMISGPQEASEARHSLLTPRMRSLVAKILAAEPAENATGPCHWLLLNDSKTDMCSKNGIISRLLSY